MPDDLLMLDVTGLGAALRTRRTTAVELARLCLDRLDAQPYNAVATVTRELALAQAEQADRELAAGHDRGPLHGIPYGAKDLYATAGIPTEWGSPAHKGQVFKENATVVRKMREAGAVLVAKLAMIELAGGGNYTIAGASSTGPCKNPWDVTRWAGGSSSGPGAAVAARLVPVALGSETWGSILCPSAFCGLSGLRPTYGRVSRAGAMALSWTMDKVGPMGKSAADCRLVFQVLAGRDPLDPSTALARPLRAPRKMPKSGWRVAVLPTAFDKPTQQAAKRRFTAATAQLDKLGMKLVPSPVKALDPRADPVAELIIGAEGAASFESLIRDPVRRRLLADPAQAAGLLAGLDIPAADYLRALRLRTEIARESVELFRRVDVLVAPTYLRGAVAIAGSLNETWTDDMGGGGGLTNLAGWPGMTIPIGTGDDGLPLGMELIGPPNSEAILLDLAERYQSATRFHLDAPKT